MVTGIIMAAGYSRRMGKNKLLMDFRGQEIIKYVIDAVIESNIEDIILIYRDWEVYDIGKSYGLKCIHNKNASLGQSQSVVLGVQNSSSTSYMFFVADQPFITGKFIDQLIKEHRKDRKKIIVPKFNKKKGMPIIFPNDFRSSLLKVQGDRGGREIILNNPDRVRQIQLDDEKLLLDIDTLEEYNYWNRLQS